MRLIKVIAITMLVGGLALSDATASMTADKKPVNINFNNLKIEDLIKITSKSIKKNILMTNNINGTVDFISNKQLYQKDILNVLIYVLESKGYTIVDNDDILRVVRINDAAKYNLPVISKEGKQGYFHMITEVFEVHNQNVDYVSSKIRHLISKSAKLVTDKNSNVVVLTDFPDNIQTVQKVIALLSQDGEKYIKNIELKNLEGAALLGELKAVAKAVFNESVNKEKVEILVNKDTNSLMLVGKQENVKFMTEYITKIDQKGSLVERIVEVISLKNVEAKNVIAILNSVVTKKKYKNDYEKPLVSSDEESNSVVLMGPRSEVLFLQELIGKLDVDKPQVYVKARIIEISEQRTKNIGIRYGLEGLMSGGAGAFTFAGNLGGASVALSQDTLSQVDIPNVSDGLILGTSINLLKQNYALDVVSEPSILCINNKESSIYVGETTSVPTNTNNGTTTTTSYQREDIGLKLKVKPRISSGDKVSLEINAILEDVSKEKTDDNGNPLPPDTNKKELSTQAIVNNGESVVLGGLIKNKTLMSEDKVPFFGDIPVLGALFRNTKNINDKQNLVVVLTPYIIPSSKDLTYIRQELAELKILEEKYSKDLMLRLEKKRLKMQEDDLERDEEKRVLDEVRKELKERREEFEQEKISNRKQSQKETNPQALSDQELHEQRVQQMLGY